MMAKPLLEVIETLGVLARPTFVVDVEDGDISLHGVPVLAASAVTHLKSFYNADLQRFRDDGWNLDVKAVDEGWTLRASKHLRAPWVFQEVAIERAKNLEVAATHLWLQIAVLEGELAREAQLARESENPLDGVEAETPEPDRWRVAYVGSYAEWDDWAGRWAGRLVTEGGRYSPSERTFRIDGVVHMHVPNWEKGGALLLDEVRFLSIHPRCDQSIADQELFDRLLTRCGRRQAKTSETTRVDEELARAMRKQAAARLEKHEEVRIGAPDVPFTLAGGQTVTLSQEPEARDDD